MNTLKPGSILSTLRDVLKKREETEADSSPIMMLSPERLWVLVIQEQISSVASFGSGSSFEADFIKRSKSIN